MELVCDKIDPDKVIISSLLFNDNPTIFQQNKIKIFKHIHLKLSNMYGRHRIEIITISPS